MKRTLLLFIFLLVAVAGASAQGTAFRITSGTTLQRPTGCSIVGATDVYVDNTLHLLYVCKSFNVWSTGISIDGSVAGANTALSNLGITSINAALLAQTGIDLGSTVKPFRDLFLFGSGTYATTYLRLTGTPTGARVLGLPDASDTLVGKATTDTFTNKTYDTAGTGNSFSINGVAVTANTGTGAVARAAAPIFTTPTLGAAAATTLNGNTFTTGTYTLTGVASKTLAFNNSLTLAGTDSTTLTFQGTDTYVGRATTDTLTNKTLTDPVIANIAPGADFTVTQNSVAAIKSINSGAIVNTIVANAGIVGIDTTLTTGATAGDVVLTNNHSVRGSTAAGTNTRHLISLTSGNVVSIDSAALGTVFGGTITSSASTSALGTTGSPWQSLNVTKTITTGGTTGAQTINTSAGSVNFAATATSLVVTNSLVATTSVIHCTVATNDTTFKSAQCVPASGSFTIFANAAATAETRVNFFVLP